MQVIDKQQEDQGPYARPLWHTILNRMIFTFGLCRATDCSTFDSEFVVSEIALKPSKWLPSDPI